MEELEKSNFIDYINNNNLDIKSINIYLGTRNKDKLEEAEDLSKEQIKKQNKIKIFTLKSIDLNGDYFENAKKHIIKELNGLKNKKQKDYDTHKENNEIITLYNEDLNKIKILSDIKEYFNPNSQKKPLPFSNFNEKNIFITIIHILLSDSKEITFFSEYQYNSLLKETWIFNSILGNKADIIDSNKQKTIVLNFRPMAILFEKAFLVLNSKIEDDFNFEQFYNEHITEKKTLIESVMSISTSEISNKQHKKLIVRGIKSDSINKFKKFSSKEKTEKINVLKEAYKKRYEDELKVEINEEGKIIMDKSAKGKEAIFKFLANKSAVKIMEETLATTLD